MHLTQEYDDFKTEGVISTLCFSVQVTSSYLCVCWLFVYSSSEILIRDYVWRKYIPCLDAWLCTVDRAFQPAPQVRASGVLGLFWQLGQHSATQGTASGLGLAWMSLVHVS